MQTRKTIVRWAAGLGAALAAGAALPACMTGPTDGDVLPERFTPILFQGYATSPGAPVEVQVERADGSAWDAFAGAIASSTPVVDAAGSNWYYWSVEVPPPRAGRYWPATSSGSSANLRALLPDGNAAYTFDEAQKACVVQGVAAQKGYVKAASDCGVSKTEVTVHAPCDRLVAGGCYDFPTLAQIGDYPFDRSMEFSNGLQGVSHDDDTWYFTSAHRTPGDQLSRIARKHVSGDLNAQPAYFGNPYAPGHKHFGDLDHHEGKLYVALEPGDGNAGYNAVGVFRASDLAYYPALPVPAASPQRTGSFPWLARNPRDGLFYSSSFDGANVLYKYAITSGGIIYVGSVPLSKTLNAVQGGDFSDAGRLYLSSNSKATGAVNVVELADPASAVVLGTGDLTWDPDDGEEIEGLTVWDLDDGRAPGVGGQIHVLMIQQEVFSNDDWYFKHLRASPANEL